jgi:hypothetical membrane protein
LPAYFTPRNLLYSVVVRIVTGLILIAAGLWGVSGIGGSILIIVGLVPLLAGVFDRCVFAPLFGLPFVGSNLRSALDDKHQHA